MAHLAFAQLVSITQGDVADAIVDDPRLLAAILNSIGDLVEQRPHPLEEDVAAALDPAGARFVASLHALANRPRP